LGSSPGNRKARLLTRAGPFFAFYFYYSGFREIVGQMRLGKYASRFCAGNGLQEAITAPVPMR